MERMYDIVAINENTGKTVKMNGDPLTHKEACTVKSKISQHPARRVQLVEVKTAR